MKLHTKNFLLLFFLFISSGTQFAYSQSANNTINSGEKYDEIIDLNSLETIKATRHEEVTKERQKDELELFLPKPDSELFRGWTTSSEATVWTFEENAPELVPLPKDLINELKTEKILKQNYKNKNLSVDVFIYKFKDFSAAYSAYTVLHTGAITKLKVGKNASESDNSITFWKGNYYVDIHTQTDNDKMAKEFIILASQEISNNIKQEQSQPVVAIQLPALNRVQGSEKYCLGNVCLVTYISEISRDFEVGIFRLEESGGIIHAEYDLQEDTKDKERISLSLTRYLTKKTAGIVFNTLRETLEKKKSENKEMDIDIDLEDGIVQVKNKKNDFIFLKQKGNLLAIVHGATNKKSGEKILNLIPWPIEINKPVNTEGQ